MLTPDEMILSEPTENDGTTGSAQNWSAGFSAMFQQAQAPASPARSEDLDGDDANSDPGEEFPADETSGETAAEPGEDKEDFALAILSLWFVLVAELFKFIAHKQRKKFTPRTFDTPQHIQQKAAKVMAKVIEKYSGPDQIGPEFALIIILSASAAANYGTLQRLEKSEKPAPADGAKKRGRPRKSS